MRHKDVAGYDAEGSRKNLDLRGMHLPVWLSQFRDLAPLGLIAPTPESFGDAHTCFSQVGLV